MKSKWSEVEVSKSHYDEKFNHYAVYIRAQDNIANP